MKNSGLMYLVGIIILGIAIGCSYHQASIGWIVIAVGLIIGSTINYLGGE